MRCLTNVAHPEALRGPAMPALDSELPLTIAHLRHSDMEAVIGGDNAVHLILVLSEGHFAERRRAGAWSRNPTRVGNVTVTDPNESTAFAMRGQANVVKLLIPLAGLQAVTGMNHAPNVIARFGELQPELGRCAQRALVALHEGDGSDRLLLSSMILYLHGNLLEQPSTGGNRAVGGLARRHMRRVQELIQERSSAPIATSPSLTDLAAEAGLSVHHFAREFKRSTGVTPYAYMLRARLDRARQLVVQTSCPLARVGILCGFPSAAHFTERFRREMGVSPGALRRAVQW